MTQLKHLQQFMTDRRLVLLEDGRTGRIVRLDTIYPNRSTTVSVWTEGAAGPGLAKVEHARVLGLAPALVSA